MSKQPFLYKILALIGLSVSSIWALSGTLTDNNNNPLSGADVFLVNQNLHCTTDETGSFSFAGVAVHGGSAIQKRFAKPVLSGNGIFFSLNSNTTVEYSIFSLNGALVVRSQNTLSEGNHYLSFNQCNKLTAKSTYVIRFKSEGKITNFKYTFSNSNYSRGLSPSDDWSSEAFISDKKTAKAQASAVTTIDTVIITKVVEGVTSIRKIRVYSYADDINSTKYTANGKQMVILDPSNDNDGDGLSNYEERYVYFTNSELADTDGDGVSDKQELTDHTNPLIADIPSVSFVAPNYPVITPTFSKSLGSEDSREISTGGEYSNSTTYTSEQQVNASVSVALMVGAEYSAEGPKISGQLTTTVGAGFSQTWSSEQAASLSKNWSDTKAIATSNDVTITGGTISMEIELINNSNQQITLVNPLIRLTSTSYQSSTISTEIGELQLATEDKTVTIGVGAGANKQTRIFTAPINNPDILEKIATMSTGLVAQLTNVQFQSSTDSLMTNVYRRTSQVVIDYGPATKHALIKNRIATNNKYNDFYTSYLDRYSSATLSDVLKTAGVKVACGTTDSKYGITSIDSLDNGAFANGKWSVACQNQGDSTITLYSAELGGYNPDTIRVSGVDIVDCIYDADQDNDGVPTRVESILGTDDKKIDSDGDGISDKDEFMGWKRDTDPAGTNWKTNPLSMDTDGDGINDYTDPNPLKSATSPLDSIVSFSKIAVTSLQGTKWTDTVFTTDTLSVSEIVRGPGAIGINFSHAVYSVRIFSKNTNHTDTLYAADTTGTYTAKLNLTLGDNTVEITVVSRNGASTKTIVLKSIQRRLARIDATNTALFSVTDPSEDKLGIAMNYYINIDKIKAIDPLITNVLLVRTDIPKVSIDAGLTSNTEYTNKIIANNLGDAGDGVANLAAGNSITGKDGAKNPYKVINITSATVSPTDTGLNHLYDYDYFPYAANLDGGKQYYTAPLNSSGFYKSNNRTIVIDTITFTEWPIINYSVLGAAVYPWNLVVQGKATIGSWTDSARIYAQSVYANNAVNATIICSAHPEMNSSSLLLFSDYTNAGASEGSYRYQELTFWHNITGNPPSTSFYNIVLPSNHDNWVVVNNTATYKYGPCQTYYNSSNYQVTDAFYVQFHVGWRWKYNN